MSATDQLVMLGCDQPSVDDELRRLLERHPVGGVFLHGDALGAPQQVRDLTAELQRLATVPFFIAVNQEGGPAQAWGPPHQAPIPAAAQMGWDYEATGELLEVTLLALEVGRQLKAAGINLDLAPVLDVHTCPENPIIGERSFGARPELVMEVGGAFIEGLHTAGVLACGKHFPGHDAARLAAVELLPFAAAMSRGLEVVMTAHVVYPAWDGDRCATVSPAIIDGVLRDELGFTGVVVTDELKMEGLRDRHDLVEAGLLALEAGCDLLLSASEPERREELLAGLEQARADGRLSDERLAASIDRIAAVKQGWLVTA